MCLHTASPHARNVAPSANGGFRPRRQDFHLFAYDGLLRLASHKVFQSRPRFNVLLAFSVSDRTVRLLWSCVASRQRKQQRSGLVHRASVVPDKPLSWHPALRTGSVRKSKFLPLAWLVRPRLPGATSYPRSRSASCCSWRRFSYGAGHNTCDTISKDKSHAQVIRHNRRNIQSGVTSLPGRRS